MLTSTSNPRIKETLWLYERRDRERLGLFLLEGIAEIDLALKNNIEITVVFYCSSLLDESAKEIDASLDCEKIEVDEKVFARMAYRGTTGGLLAVAKNPQRKIADLKLSKQPLVIVIEGMEKPGNIGAILRTADAAAVDAVIVCESDTDLYNPNIVRSSLGSIFSVPVFETDNKQALAWLKQNNLKIMASALTAQKDYAAVDFKQPAALIIGSENSGLTKFWLDNADEQVLIPMQGQVNSLNASVSTAILIYEAVRQRK